MGLKELIETGKESRKLLLLIVYVALFLDNMLLTTVVPIIPEYLFRLEHPNETHMLLKPEDRPTEARLPPTPEGPPLVRLNAIAKSQRVRTNIIGYGMIPLNGLNHSSKEDYAEGGPPEEGPGDGSGEGSGREEEEDMGPPPTLDPIMKEREHKLLVTENIRVGLMFGSKALVQLMVNPFIGLITNRVGYTVPMFTGFVIMFLSTVMFAFGETYGVLFFARTLQGIGSACTSTSGMGMLAQRYPDDKERGAAMGIALGGLALGVLVGPPYGGILYQWSGKELPFLILAFLALFDGTLQYLVLKPKIEPQMCEATSFKVLMKDPYIMVGAGSITIGNLGIAMLEPSLPLWMMETMHANSAERGAAFLPASISYLVGTNIFGPLAHKIGRWLSALLGLLIIGCCLIGIPSATGLGGLIVPNGFMGFAIGMIDASMFPQMGYLVDLRHVGVYGNIYAIADAAFCLAFAFGPYISGPIVRGIGFGSMLYLIAAVNFIYAPMMLFLRNPPAITANEKQQLVNSDALSLSYAENGNAPQSVANEFYNSESYGY